MLLKINLFHRSTCYLKKLFEETTQVDKRLSSVDTSETEIFQDFTLSTLYFICTLNSQDFFAYYLKEIFKYKQTIFLPCRRPKGIPLPHYFYMICNSTHFIWNFLSFSHCIHRNFFGAIAEYCHDHFCRCR